MARFGYSPIHGAAPVAGRSTLERPRHGSRHCKETGNAAELCGGLLMRPVLALRTIAVVVGEILQTRG